MTTRSAPDFDGTTFIFENETTTNFSIGLQETNGASLYNPPLRWNMQQQGSNFQG